MTDETEAKAMAAPIILNFDDSVGKIEGARCLNLQQWQEKIRFACSWRDFNALSAELQAALPPAALPPAAPPIAAAGTIAAPTETIFLGSGDYHHISYILLKRLGESLRAGQKIDAVILDNHPDNMRYPFGIHCGSWVSWAAKLPFIDHINVIGICSNDIGLAHAAENRLSPLRRGKLTYWSVGLNVGWARPLGLARAFRNFACIEDMAAAFLAEQQNRRRGIYFSLDKDVLASSVVQTNWDQGSMGRETLFALIAALKSRIIAADIVGEISDYSYKSRFKRWLSRLDGQKPVPPQALAAWQAGQHNLNRQLVAALA